ncbi:Ribosomal protein S18 acetylase RimI [Pseudobutyrivibrio sp. UC1225]|uniref:GNAT family N-acetyltransferase n=1 Tax=Pseudobutyrivibrio sp. UC1225 TaxID=1798185 RepID=UPI0008ED1B82|nr:GNAT family N-acetyltransferase [Pseudobutyrivibrio sp. UC1225]SFN98014.1 Ribosomal protein S18 acetylase RimI [Pseudobutyrivibrio sp. UC1225]
MDIKYRKLTEEDIPSINNLCCKNELYYQFCPPFVTEESIKADMEGLPPGKTSDDKYYVGYFENNKLIAVMDLIYGYPAEDTAYVGFFMTDDSVQKKGVGTRIIKELTAELCKKGFAQIKLAWVQGNPQAEHFWHKNGFKETGKIYDMGDYSVVDAARTLVTEVNEDNVEAAARIHSVSWQESHLSFCTKEFIAMHDVKHQKEYIEKKIADGSEFYMLMDEEPVAVVSITGSLIEDLYVLPELQNKGYGSQLLYYVISKIQKKRLAPTLWILENNDGAERLYRRNGFVPSGNVNQITDKLDEIEFVLK